MGQWRGSSESNRLLSVGIIAVRAFWMFLMAAVLAILCCMGNAATSATSYFYGTLSAWAKTEVAGDSIKGDACCNRTSGEFRDQFWNSQGILY